MKDTTYLSNDYGWKEEDNIEILPSEDKKELEHLLLMFLNRAKRKVIDNIRKRLSAR